MVAFIEFDTAGINHGELMVQPFCIQVNSVPGNAGHIVNDGNAFLANLIEQGGLAHIRASYDGNDRFAHCQPSFF